MKKVLILGASGYVGRHLGLALGPERAILASRRGGPGHLPFDAETTNLHSLLSEPGAVSHGVILFAENSVVGVARDPAAARRINIDATCRLVQEMAELGIKPVFTSSDTVFGVGPGPRTEGSPTEPTLAYGKQKKEMEDRLFDLAPDALVFRLSKIYGLTPGDGTLITGFADKIMTESRMKVVTDFVFSPIAIDDVVAAIQASMAASLSGLYHLGGPESVTHMDLFQCLADLLGKQVDRDITVETCSINDVMQGEWRAPQCAISSAKLTAVLGQSFLSTTDACRTVADRILNTDRTADIENFRNPA